MGLCIGTKNAEYEDTFRIGYGGFYALKLEIMNSISKRAGELCEQCIEECNTCDGDPEIDCIDCSQGGKAILAHQILELLQE